MFFRQIEDPHLAQYAYLIGCQASGEALLIDPERDIDRYVKIAQENNLKIVAVAETHIHADFVSGLREFAQNYAVKVYVSAEGGTDWQYDWQCEPPARMYHLRHGDRFHIGKIEFEAVHTPGHTPEHLCYLITDRGSGADDAIGIVTGDFVFVGDVGRPDLLETAAGKAGAKEPAAKALYLSLLEFFQLPDYLQVWPGHGAGSVCGKSLGAVPDSTVGYERRFNRSLLAAQDGEESFVREILSGQPEPPPYFAQMKTWNKQGPPLLPTEFKLNYVDPAQLGAMSRNSNTVIVDTRIDRSEFFSGHVHGSLWIPLTKSFPSYAGSMITPDQKIIVICHNSQAEQAVRLLWRIGLDNLVGVVGIPDFHKWVKSARPILSQLNSTSFSDVVNHPKYDLLVDVRTESEYDAGHLPGAVNFPAARLAVRIDELPREKKLTLYCSSGSRSTAAASYLKRLGYHATTVDDDIEALTALLERGHAGMSANATV